MGVNYNTISNIYHNTSSEIKRNVDYSIYYFNILNNMPEFEREFYYIFELQYLIKGKYEKS